jgi:hypothetical protein
MELVKEKNIPRTFIPEILFSFSILASSPGSPFDIFATCLNFHLSSPHNFRLTAVLTMPFFLLAFLVYRLSSGWLSSRWFYATWLSRYCLLSYWLLSHLISEHQFYFIILQTYFLDSGFFYIGFFHMGVLKVVICN